VLLRLAALSALMFSSAASAADALKQPTGKWIAEYADDECLLSRPYGSDSTTLILTLRQLPMETWVGVIVFKNGTRGETAMGTKGNLAFGGEPISKTFSAFDLAGKPIRRIETGVKLSELMAAVQSAIVSVSVPGEVQEDFAVPELGSALEVLGDCALKLGAAWGIPIEQQKRVKVPPKLLKAPFDSFDYPNAALRKDMSGRTEVRLTIDDRGRPLDCIPLKSTPDQVFARTSCSVLMKRAHFKPAVDIDGRPMKSIYVQTINFQIAG
jgi:hypothetical protein